MHNVAIPFLRKGREVLPADGEESWLIWTYGKAPLRLWSSMIVGSVANWAIPVFLRPLLYGAYSNFFGVNMDEAVESGDNFSLTVYCKKIFMYRRSLRNRAAPASKRVWLDSSFH